MYNSLFPLQTKMSSNIKSNYLFKVILPLNEDILHFTLVFINFHLNHKYILINDELQYDFDLIPSKHSDVSGYTLADISNSRHL
jgi:hypothetical protein